MIDAIQQFRAALAFRGIVPPVEIIADGEFHRCDAAGKIGQHDATYKLHLDGVPAGGFENHRDGLGWQAWKVDIGRPLSAAETEAQRARVDAARRVREQAEEVRHEAAATDASVLWSKSKTAAPNHPYLVKKGVNNYGLRVDGGDLIVPITDVKGKLTTVQRIDENGEKRFLQYGRKRGSYFGIGNPVGTIYIVEGYATGASVHEATEHAVAVAFDCGNLLPVAKALRARFPEIQIVLAADDDIETEGNPGMTKAREAAKAVGGSVAMPAFGSSRKPGQTDFNDLHQAQGLDAVRKCFAKVLDEAPDDEHPDLHRNAPRADPAALYGLIGEIARAAAETTEANPFAVALNVINYLSAAVGRVAYLPVGNTWHHPRLFGIHVGRTGRGRKGDAVSIVHRIDMAIRAKDEYIAPQVHRGGLSSREGLAYLIHDGYMDGKTEVAPIHDKRLWVVESEFANVLSQTKREGNTLSAALRDCWDGVSIRPATKTSRVWASDPHVTLSCAVTPGELRSMLAARELTNGFANRFMMVYAERDHYVAFPQATPQDKIDDFASRIIDVLRTVGADRHVETDARRMQLTPAAQELYEKLYLGELNDQSAGELVNALIERRAPTLLRLAMLFAIFDKSEAVDVPHVEAGLAWVRLWTDSVKFVFASALDEVTAAETSATADKIIKFLADKGSASRKAITVECFGGHLSKDKIDAALDELLLTTPARIEVETAPTAGRPAKIYRLTDANKAKVAKDQQRRALQPDSHAGEYCEAGEESYLTQDDVEAFVSDVRLVRDAQEQAATRMDIGSSPSSPSSHGELEIATQEPLTATATMEKM
ncbi:toprim domain-containing protein [Variovorax sp. J22R115]|uniref:toprim domain-containing protein n=1 Tax=Variovorax sp. J22R115 TaxID=3053509 RepID=UPI0025791D0F|nr:toprim domain-containing protein [Variovorax sp. J22R115]MDM0051413.1 toprim domain-containing protein [Variovorax sp. J22R115]